MIETEIRTLIQQELPQLLTHDATLRDFIVRSLSEYYAGKPDTESRFDRVLNELERDRQEQARKWDTFNQEQARKWDAFSQEQARKWDDQMAENHRMDKRFNSTMGAIGSRWGLHSEASFRNGLKGILQDSFGVEVINLNEFDDDGDVFGEPDQVEIDIIIKNGVVIVCEIKSSIDKAGMYIFNRKVAFYEKHHRSVTRKMVICPMVDARALPVAERLGIEIYSYADEVENL